MPVITNCLVCNKEIRKKPSAAAKGQGKYCSVECMSIGYVDRNKGNGNPNYRNAGNKVCLICHKDFKSYNTKQKFCSANCAKASLKKKIVKTCLMCGNEFEPKGSERAKRKYCSPKCSAKAVGVNRRVSVRKTKRKYEKVCSVCGREYATTTIISKCCSRSCANKLSGISQRKTVKFTCAICGKVEDVSPSQIKFGKKVCSLECCREYSRLRQLGDKSHRWQGGKTQKTMLHRNSLPYQQWRTAVFKRDEYTCQLCGNKGG